MVEKLRTGKWANQLATQEEVEDKVREIMVLVTKYGWENENIHPYGFPINVLKFLEKYETYSLYTHSSKQILLAEINGAIDIFNMWAEQEEEPKVKVRLLTGRNAGKIKEIPASMVGYYVETDLAEIVKEN